MACFATRKLCSTTSNTCKQTATTNCEGCLQAFCTKHFIEHRQILGEEMNVIISEHNHLQHTFNQQSTELDSHPFASRINEWEKKSIEKIQRKANDLRRELIQLTKIRRDELSKRLQYLANQLNENRENDNFIEMDLQQWKTTLQDLKTMLDLSLAFTFEEHDQIPLIHNISLMFTIEDELFRDIFDNTVQIKQNGQVVIHNSSFDYTEIRGKNEYITGRHKIRFFIEQVFDKWTFLGIISKLTPLQKQSYNSKSSYGWSTNNYMWLNGQCQKNKSACHIEMKSNDSISLIIDCEKHQIFMINERTNVKYQLDVNIDQCPFPWQLHLNLYEANSCVRILSA